MKKNSFGPLAGEGRRSIDLHVRLSQTFPTGIEIKYMKERNQSLNRFLARRELVKRIEKLSGQLTPEDVIIER